MPVNSSGRLALANRLLELAHHGLHFRVGIPYQVAIRYADRHDGRALTPVMIMGTSGLKRSIGLRNLMTALEQLRSFGDYIQSGQTRKTRTSGQRGGRGRA